MKTTYRWNIMVIKYNTYGDQQLSRTPMSLLADNREEVTEKVREAFNATYDDFRKFWSHGWTLVEVNEEVISVETEQERDND